MNIDSFESAGFLVTPPLIGEEECAIIESSLSTIQNIGIGSRDLLENEWCQKLAQSLRKAPLILPLLQDDAVAVQCTYFEKSKDQNWLVSVHQDLSIPVQEKVENSSLTGWSAKDGSVFVQPPVNVLEKMVAVRLHLDECGPNDGPLKVVPGSHGLGRLSNEAALVERNIRGEYICTVQKGAALLIRPLVLHASSKASGNSKRRVLHFVFGPRALPFGLRWRHAV